MKNIKKISNAYNDMETALDLKRANLTLTDYKVLGYLIQDLEERGSTETFSLGCANWFKQFKELLITPTTVGFKIEVK